MGKIVVERDIAGRTLQIETGRIARQASGATLVTYGGSVVLVAVAEQKIRAGQDFFPLLVDYRERGAAAGMIWGGRFMKREGRPSDKETLTMRLIDRPVRPLFPEGYLRDVMIQCIVLSADPENDPDLCAMIGASAALTLSALPWQGPTGSCRLGYVDGEYVVNPTYEQRKTSDLDLLLSAKKDAVAMVEAGANELSEEIMIGAIEKGHEVCREICAMIEELAAKAPPVEKHAVPELDTRLAEQLTEEFLERAMQAACTPTKFGRRDALKDLRSEIVAAKASDDEDGKPGEQEVKEAFHEVQATAIRKLIQQGKRCDGRANDAVRDVECEVTVLPRTHGSALFTRGETQAIVSVTLGTVGDEQLVESLHGEYSMRFLLHYNFPSFCVGEVKPNRGPGRREIGHGSLARRAMMPVLPDFEEFPYTIRVISDITESNGSSSMASVCGATLALMDAGVPIKQPVAGIAMGLVVEGEDVQIVSDILGDEDHYGDMDFKVAGTQHGVTALQMDIKVGGLTAEVMKRALDQAREGRILILKTMLQTLQQPRDDIPPHAPKIVQIKIDPDLIGKVIGPGGKTIRQIQEDTGARIDVDNDGVVCISAIASENADKARKMVERLTEQPEVGRIYEGEVRSIRDFGIFVEFLPGKDGMVHISELDVGYVKNASDVVKVGEIVRVKLTSVDDLGRVRLSRKAVLEEQKATD